MLAAAPASAETIGAGGIGFAFGYQTETYETPDRKIEFSNKSLLLDCYIANDIVYAKFSSDLFGLTHLSSDGTVTDKATNTTMPLQGGGDYSNDAFIFALPRIEGGPILLADQPVHPTVGLYLGDSHATLKDDHFMFAIDTGLAVGAAFVMDQFAVQATARVNFSFYKEQTHFFAGRGEGLEILAAFNAAKTFGAMIRAGLDWHTLPGDYTGDAAGDYDLEQSGRYVRFALLYTPSP
jgi:hypothetical protein